MVGGLWWPARAPPRSDGRRASPARHAAVHDADNLSDSRTASSEGEEPREWTYVDIDAFEATF
jgi:hypothetical protein